MQNNEVDAIFMMKLLAAGQFLMTLVIGALTIWKSVKREPPLHEAYASRAEHKELATKVSESAKDIGEKLDKLEQSFTSREDHKELVSQVGELSKETREGFAKMEESRRTSVSKAYQHTEKLVSDMGASIKSDLQEMRRNMRSDNEGVNQRVDTVLKAVSRLEGKMEQNSTRQKEESK